MDQAKLDNLDNWYFQNSRDLDAIRKLRGKIDRLKEDCTFDAGKLIEYRMLHSELEDEVQDPASPNEMAKKMEKLSKLNSTADAAQAKIKEKLLDIEKLEVQEKNLWRNINT